MDQAKKEIKYIGFYDIPGSSSPRVCNQAAINKMDYICNSLNRVGFSVKLISPSWIDHSMKGKWFDRGGTVVISPKKRLSLCPSFQTRFRLTLYLKVIFSLTWLFFWLVINAHQGEKIIAYHSPWLSIPLRWAKWIKGFRLILEVEEIYGDVQYIHPYFNILERKLIATADYYIFSTELLRERITISRPTIILYGVYYNYDSLTDRKNDDKIHLLYSGIIDFHKAGAFNAIESARFLPANYVLHILGFGEINALKSRIAELKRNTQCEILYEGMMSGTAFIRFGQSCHIGLSTQKTSGEYLSSSFPSKILTYLALGLRVVSCRIECVTKSKVDELITYYNNDSPEAIAQAIMSVNLHEKNSTSRLITELDNGFLVEIKELLDDK